MPNEQDHGVREPGFSTVEIEAQFDLYYRMNLVVTAVHARDHVRRTETDFLAKVTAMSLLADGIVNAIDGRSTGREWRTVRHGFRGNRAVVADEDRRCCDCGAIRPRPFSHCYEHRRPSVLLGGGSHE